MFQVNIRGTTPLIMHSGSVGLDTTYPANIEKKEITSKRGGNRTEADDARLRELECQTSLWLDEKQTPTIPVGALRRCIENAARKSKEGPAVREGLMVESVQFDYDKKSLGTTVEEIGRKAQFTVGVVIQRARILRTRAKFDEWSAVVMIDADDELIDREKLERWLDIGARRIGLGDWRPEKSGSYGRFEVVSVKEV
ncbi:MAG: hypothetical protein OD918_00145 [Gammaproteobacteria bacterium]